jgi:hypothetical protein
LATKRPSIISNQRALKTKACADGAPKSFSINVATPIEIAKIIKRAPVRDIEKIILIAAEP